MAVADGAAGGDFYSWQLRGSCRGYPTDWFFPEEETRKRVRRERERAAKGICMDCPVLATCREYAMKTPEKHGVWGATTARERALTRRSAAQETAAGLAS